MMAARRLATDPVVQAKAKEIARDEIAPRVGDAIEQARPVVAGARRRVERAVDDLRDVADDHPPTEDPKAFLKAARSRLANKE